MKNDDPNDGVCREGDPPYFAKTTRGGDKPPIDGRRLYSTLSPEYSRCLGRGALVVGLILAASVLLLDGGVAVRATLIAVLGYLAGVAVMALRRPQTPTATDLNFLRWGFAPLWSATYACALAWAWFGNLLK